DDLMLGGNRNSTYQATQGQRAGVAHEDGSWRRVKPQEPKAGTNNGTKNNRQFACAGGEVDLEIVGEDGVTGKVRNDAKRCRSDHDRNDRKAIKTIRHVDRI